MSGEKEERIDFWLGIGNTREEAMGVEGESEHH